MADPFSIFSHCHQKMRNRHGIVNATRPPSSKSPLAFLIFSSDSCFMATQWKTRVAVVLCWFLCALFLYAGTIKLLDMEVLIRDIQSYRILPNGWVFLFAYLLLVVEILAACLLLFPGVRKTGLWLVAGLLLVFLVAILSAWFRGLEISCGCFGIQSGPANYAWLILRDLALLGLTLIPLRLLPAIHPESTGSVTNGTKISL